MALLSTVICGQADQPVAEGKGPMLKFANDTFEAGKVPAGQPLSHTFIFTNTGDATLEITQVHPTCGCTVAGTWTHKVEPGQTGEIPLTVNVNQAWSGQMMKTITIDSNDKTRTNGPAAVNIKFTVWKPIDINQQYVFLNVPPESTSEVSTIVRIDNNTDQPLAVYDVQASTPGIGVQIKTNDIGKHYDLLVSAKPPYKQGNNVSGQITAKTSSTNMPTISIGATVNIMPIVSVNPPQILLDAPPLANVIYKTNMIQYLGSGSLQLSNAVFSAKGVDVKVEEDEKNRGKIFFVVLSFPAGFESVGKPMELTMDSSAPQMPVIKVMVNQMPRQAGKFVPSRPTAAVAPVLPPQARANAH